MDQDRKLPAITMPVTWRLFGRVALIEILIRAIEQLRCCSHSFLVSRCFRPAL